MHYNKDFNLKEAILFIEQSVIGSHQSDKEHLVSSYLEYIKKYSMRNSVLTYRGYRAAYRVVHGTDLSEDRPIRRARPIETQQEMF